MELIVLYSIIIFSILILALFLYLVIEKLYDKYKNKKKRRYQDSIASYLDNIVSQLDEKDITEIQINILSEYIRHKIKREVVEERMLFYFENFKGSISGKLTKLAEEIGLVEYELEKLSKKDFHKIALACKHLGDIRSKKVINPLLELIDIEHVEIKYNVLMALAKIGDNEAFIEAFKKLTKSIPLSERSLVEIADSFEGDKIYVYRNLIYIEDEFISSIFIKSAGNYKDTTLADEIAFFLAIENKEKKIAAMKALGNMGDNRYVEPIISLLSDETWEVRAIAAKVLGQLQSDNAIIPLTTALSDREWYVRYNAANSLVSIEGGIDMVYDILEGEDRFAKDIIVSILETSYGWDRVIEYDKTTDRNPKLSEIVKKYTEEKDR
ncbi:PBS lyase [Fervidicella metallireducens AeB]|uniref:PBS lyase n=1 Tax=Fervidicella metallireducens AeB TaxID=1403537 RepID=A0A017RXB2_9CLOT|nr:HEAT repeat domain-containing protein [Fervidicella metallireducens]EYE88535.1 PBS lyase [Fervidicella metallireducens AeB]